MANIRHGFTRPLADPVLPTADTFVAELRPRDALLCLRPDAIAAAAHRFAGAFPGDVLYAVKCNPEPRVLHALWTGGVRHFDCASIAEVRLVRGLLPATKIHFMHLVKARPAIAEAFDRLEVTDFVFDSADVMKGPFRLPPICARAIGSNWASSALTALASPAVSTVSGRARWSRLPTRQCCRHRVGERA